MSPLPGSRVIHPRFAAAHRPVAEGTMTAQIVVRRDGGAGSFNPTTGKTTRSQSYVWSGPARIQPQARLGDEQASGEQTVTAGRYLVAVPADVNVLEQDLVTVTSGNDPTIAGLRLRVSDVHYASETWQKDLTCYHEAPTGAP